MAVLWNSQFPFTEMNARNIMKCVMRRTSMEPGQAAILALFIQKHRMQAKLSMRELAEKSKLQLATLAGLEAGTLLSPQPDTVASLAGPLRLTVTDLYTAAGWLPPNELPAFRPYMRAKYRDLDDDAIAELEQYAERLIERHGTTGPTSREDEYPE